MLLARFVALFVTAGLVGCSGAAAQDLFEPVPATSDLAKTEPAANGAGATTKGGANTQGGKADKGGTADKPTTQVDPTEPNTIAGDDDDAQQQGGDRRPPPEASCAVEQEGNDSADRATPFTSCISGKLTGSRDVDFLRVVAPANARRMTVGHEEADGRIMYRVTRESDGIDLGLDDVTFTEDVPEIRVVAGATYIFRLSAPGFGGGEARERSYQLDVAFLEGR